jgi:hypothetical protein
MSIPYSIQRFLSAERSNPWLFWLGVVPIWQLMFHCSLMIHPFIFQHGSPFHCVLKPECGLIFPSEWEINRFAQNMVRGMKWAREFSEEPVSFLWLVHPYLRFSITFFYYYSLPKWVTSWKISSINTIQSLLPKSRMTICGFWTAASSSEKSRRLSKGSVSAFHARSHVELMRRALRKTTE